MKCYVSALTVRFLTRRYIGEYDHQSGKKSPDARWEALIEKFRNYICHPESDTSHGAGNTLLLQAPPPFTVYTRLAAFREHRAANFFIVFLRQTDVSSSSVSEKKISFLAKNSVLCPSRKENSKLSDSRCQV